MKQSPSDQSFPYDLLREDLKQVPPDQQYSQRLRKTQDRFLEHFRYLLETQSIEYLTNSPISFLFRTYVYQTGGLGKPNHWPNPTSSVEALRYAIFSEETTVVEQICRDCPQYLQAETPKADDPRPILLASSLGRSASVQKLITLGARASVVDNQGHSPLHYLNQFPPEDLQDVAKALVTAGADLNAQTPTPELHVDTYFQAWGTPLHWAVASNNLEAVRILLNLGADPLLSTLEGLDDAHQHFTPLHMAAGLHLPEIVDELLTRATYTFPGPWPLHMISRAAPFQKWMIHGANWKQAARRTVRVFLKHGHLVDQMDHMKQTPLANVVLLWPSYVCSEPLVRELLLQGANPDATVGVFDQPLIFHAIDGLENNPENVACLPILLQAGVNVNARDADNHTPLMMAFRYGAYAAAHLLIHWGADVHTTDNIQYTALHHAASGAAPRDAIVPLLQAGAYIDAPCDIGTTPLGIAIAGHPAFETIDALLSLGASVFVNQAVDPYHNVLHHALLGSSGDRRSVIYHLLAPSTIALRPEIAQLIHFGYFSHLWTPLHQAVSVCDYACVREFVKMGARIDAVSYRFAVFGQTPVQLAEMMVLDGARVASYTPKKRFGAIKIYRYLRMREVDARLECMSSLTLE